LVVEREANRRQKMGLERIARRHKKSTDFGAFFLWRLAQIKL
jgi:hypothetical protein